ncbi:hypothetical protein [Variovorax sp. GB1P17]|uniref:hypothetical protein n=1 Tax=Variovorax sp. GB1P17 TaxID=3443740 RepID=UPI003F47A55D
MTSVSASLLSSSGFLVLLVGFLCGAPLGSAINKNQDEERIRAWRVAHSSLVGGGVMLLAIAPNLLYVELPLNLTVLASAMLCVSVWSFTFALTFGALKGHRGTERGAGFGAAITYAANLTGVVLSMISILVLAYGAIVHLYRSLSLA